jgi:hypothetical protein
MPVSFIQKYLVKKLDLDSETEVCSSLLPYSKYNFLVGLLVKNCCDFYLSALLSFAGSLLLLVKGQEQISSL